MSKYIPKIASLEVKRKQLHDYITMKLEEQDYHAVADAAMDLREISCAINIYNYLMKQEVEVT